MKLFNYFLLLSMFGLLAQAAEAALPQKIVSVPGGINSGLVVENSKVFWVSSGAGGASSGVMSADLTDGTVTSLAPFTAGDDANLTVNNGILYWADRQAGTISSVAVIGGSPKVLASSLASPDGLVIGGQNLYWTNYGTPANNYADGSIMTVPLKGGPVGTVAAYQAYPTNLTIVDGKYFWIQSDYNADGQSSGAQIWSQSGSSNAILVATSQTGSMGPLTSAGGNLYWADGTNDIYSVPVAGGQPQLLTEQYWAWGFVADDTSLYFVSEGSQSSSACQIMKIPLKGGTVSAIASCDLAEGLTVDAQNIYWSNYDSSRSSTIYSLPKN